MALEANANVGGDNCHRGAVLGAICSLASGQVPKLYDGILCKKDLDAEIDAFLS